MSQSSGELAALAPQYERYLAVLGLRARAPEMAALHDLVREHVIRIPFENVSKLHYRRDAGMRLPALSPWLDGIERYRLGGTCYANNHQLYRLLVFLGYNVRLCGADMSRPDVHVVSIVTFAGREYLVDAGYGAPLLEPLPLDLEHDHVIALGDTEWVLRPRDREGRSRLDVVRGGATRHGYLVNPAPRRIEEFAGVIADSFAKDATFMNSVVIARFGTDRSSVLQNLELCESEGARSTRRALAETPAGLPAAIQDHFGVPADFTRAALAGIEPARTVWG